MSSANKARNNRPLSPHLTVYKPQMTSVLSITHRATGVALYIGAFVLAWGIILGIYSCNCILDLVKTDIGQILLFGWSVALFYHALNGVRHLFWDMGKGLEISTATKSGYAVLFGAVSLTAISWIIALGGV